MQSGGKSFTANTLYPEQEQYPPHPTLLDLIQGINQHHSDNVIPASLSSSLQKDLHLFLEPEAPVTPEARGVMLSNPYEICSCYCFIFMFMAATSAAACSTTLVTERTRTHRHTCACTHMHFICLALDCAEQGVCVCNRI